MKERYDDQLQKKLRRLARQINALLRMGLKLYPRLLFLGLLYQCPVEEFAQRLAQAGVAPSTANEILTIYAHPDTAQACVNDVISVREALEIARAIRNGEDPAKLWLKKLAEAGDRLLSAYGDDKPWTYDGGIWLLEFVPNAPASAKPESLA